jgi:flagellar basal-body rod modification protein FlgD
MITSVSTTTDQNTAAAAMKKTTGMNKDDFLKLLVTQLKSQDPMNPQDSSAFVAQLAQLTQVEQTYNINTNLQNLLSSQNNVSSMSAMSLIGKNITTQGSQVVLTEGSQPSLGFTLPSDATNLALQIKDATGKTVRTLNQGAASAGVNSINWDGMTDNGQPAPAGTYTFAVSGHDATGQAISGTTLFRGRVTGVNLEGDIPVLTVNGIYVPLTSVLEVKEGSV